MNWYYADAGNPVGPVTGEQFDELRRTGRITNDTLVWHEGLPDWKPWREVSAAGADAAAGAPPPAAGVLCAACGRSFRPDEVIRVHDRFICAACKPVHLQRLREGLGAPGAGASAGTATQTEVLARDYEHDLGAYVSRGWELFKSDPGTIIGATALVYLCILAANFIPYLSTVLSIVFTGPLMGGLWLFFLKKIRGQPAGVGDAFGGFGPRFGQLLLGNFIPGLLAGLCLIPVGIVVAVGVMMVWNVGRGGSPLESGMGIALVSLGGVLALVGLCGMVYLSTCWVFTLALVADKGMNFWPAMSLSRQTVLKHWWMNFLVVLVIGLVGSLGLLALCVGVLVTGPVAFAAMAYAYEKLLGDLVPHQA